MGILDLFRNKKQDIQAESIKGSTESLEGSQAESNYSDHEAYQGNWRPIKNGTFNGEKTPGELGSVYNLKPDRELLRLRAYEAKLTNDTISIICGKFFKWVVGSGLKLQAEPNEKVLKTEGVHTNLDNFRDDVESRFNVFANSKMSDYSEMENLHEKASQAFEAAFFGDVLVILRVEKGYPNVQLVDGEHIKTPFLDDKSKWKEKAKERGNFIRNGIEIDKKGKHVAFYVVKESQDNLFGEFERVEAFGTNTGRQMAWFITLKKHRIDNDRGIPIITPILEKVTKLDRYTESTVSTAEERAKIVLAIEHTKDSDGVNPLIGAQKIAAGRGNGTAKETDGFALGEKSAANIAATTSKQTFNMPVGSKLTALYAQNEIQYEPFSKAVFVYMCAAVDIPPEVALQKYDSNYSASRAAIAAWDYIIKIYRKKFSEKFYAPFYQLWLHTEILRGSVKAPNYLANASNFMVQESYAQSRFTGQNMPHIDPVKEVKAVVQMIEENLLSREQGSERLDIGDWHENFGKIVKEQEKIQAAEIKKPEDKELNVVKGGRNGTDKN